MLKPLHTLFAALISFGLLLALAPVAGAADAADAKAAAKPTGKPRLSVSRLGQPPAEAVQVGATVKLNAVIRNRGRIRGRSPVKLIVPKADGASNGKRLALKADRGFAPRGKRRLGLRFEVGKRLAPPPGTTEVERQLAVCVKRHGAGSRFRCKPTRRPLRVSTPPLPPEFKPGGRSAGDTLFPQIGNTGYDATNYAIDLVYKPSTNKLTDGTRSTMTATATQNLSELSLDFQYLTVTRVTVDGATAAFELVDAKPKLAGATQPVKLVVTPPEGIVAGSEFTVAVHYRGTPVEIVDPDGSSEGWVRACVGLPTPLTCDGGVVVNEPIGAAGWFPSNNVPADKATVATSITVPSSHTALGVGELVAKQSLAGGETRWSWSEDDPTATYLTTATVGEFDYSETTVDEALVPRTMPAYYAIDSKATPPQQRGLEDGFARIGSMIDFLGDLYGPYPFDSTGAIADNVPTLGYALEVQTKPVFAYLSRDDTTMLHEQAHQWFGNSVSPAQWSDIWFNEGWAEWSTWYWDNLANGNAKTTAQRFDEEYAQADAEDWSVPPATLNGDPALVFAHFPTYVRAPMMLEGLRQIFGDAAFFGLAKRIQAEHGYGTISTAQFVDLARQSSGLSGEKLDLLDTYLQQWLYGSVKPTVLPSSF